MNNTKPSLLQRIFFSEAEARLRSGWRLAIQFFLLVLFTILIGTPIIAILAPHGNLTSETGFLANALSLAIPATLSVYIARRALDRRDFSSLGLAWNAHAWRDLLYGILLAGLMMGLIFIVEWGLGWLHFEAFIWQVEPFSQDWPTLLVFIIAFLFTGWGEELLFRGYWLQNLAEGLNLTWGVLLSSILFAAGHSFNPNITWIAILGLVLAGFFFAFCYVRSGQLWLPIGLHIGWNFFEGTIFGFPVSGIDMFRILRQSVNGPEAITGGAFGPEAGIILLPSLVLGAVLVYEYTRKRMAMQVKELKNNDREKAA